MSRVLYLAFFLAGGALAQETASVPITPTPTAPLPTATLPTTAPATTAPVSPEEVVVEAPEPRYVAPTLRDRIGRIWAPVMINGKGPFRLVLDTGANSSAIIGTVATRLGIVPDASRKALLHGVTGSAIVPIINIDRMEVGDLLLEDSRVPIVADVFGGAEGILGVKGLSDKRIFIDFRHDLIQITHSRGQRAPVGYTSIPLTISHGQLPMFDMHIGNTKVRAILDTGAQQTIGNNNLRESLLKHERQVKTQEIVGVTLDVAQGDSIPTPPVRLADIEIRNLRITFGDMFIFEQWKMTHEPALLVGMDVIGSLDSLIIDYKLRELQLRARRSSTSASAYETLRGLH